MDYPFDLGNWTRPITTTSDAAQQWFDRGLNWTYAYNHDEAVACFRRALSDDPKCAMAWWGVAYASGPFYNRPWVRYCDAEIAEILPVCFEASQSALSLCDDVTPAERALIEALARRYQSDTELDRDVLNRWIWQYADAMRDACRAFGDDPDIAALFVEAAVTCTPRQLWHLRTGEMNGEARTDEALPVLETWLKKSDGEQVCHPGLLHMHIHAFEMSPFPQRSLTAADNLRGSLPDAGHLEHMPAHVYVLCGDYAQAVSQSEAAVTADDKYLAFAGDQNFYTTARCHNLHLLMYSAMFLGQRGKAIYAARRLNEMATPDLIAQSPPFMASILDGYAAMRAHVLVRFGCWNELTKLAPPECPELRPIGMAMHAYAQGVAHSALGQIEMAEQSRDAFMAASERISEDAIFLSNTVRDMLRIGEAMLDGELEYRKQNYAEAFSKLRLAVARDDGLNYTEPWAWMHPPRHALGALLAEQGAFDEAEAVYRADLGYDTSIPRCCQHPDNIWALRGLVECVGKAGRANELTLLQQRLDFARERADVPIDVACFCRQRTSS